MVVGGTLVIIELGFLSVVLCQVTVCTEVDRDFDSLSILSWAHVACFLYNKHNCLLQPV